MRAPLRYLILWPTAACNLACDYCYRQLRAGRPMPWSTALAALDLVAESAASDGAPFHVQLAGGEPTLVPDLVKQVVTEVRERGWPATLGVQTNATRLTPDLVQLFLDYQVQVGISLDGPPAVQERLRGQPAETYQGLALLRDAGVPVTVTTVVTSVNAPHLGELGMMLAAFSNVLGLGLDPLVALGTAADRPDLAASEEAIASGVRDLYHVLRGLRRLRSLPLVWREGERVRLALTRPADPDRAGSDYCHACRGESLAVAPDGALFPCSQAVGDPELRVGTLHDPAGIDWALLGRAFAGQRLTGPCDSCSLHGRCPGDCPSRLGATPPFPTANAAMCVIYRTLAELEQS